MTAGPFSAIPDPTPEEPYPAPAGERPEADAHQEHDTPAPMNTMPARTGEFNELVRGEVLTEPFLDLEPVVADAVVPMQIDPVALAPRSAPRPPAPSVRPTPTRSVAKELEGQIAFDRSGLFAGDAVAQLSAAISMRMAPPPMPDTDRTYAAAGWVVGTLIGLGVWVLAIWQSATWIPYVALVGGTMIALGVVWRAYLSGRRGSWVMGLLTLLPPVCLVQLVRPVSGIGLRPLWFVLSGVGLLGLFVAGGPVKKLIDDTFETTRVTLPISEPAPFDADAVAGRLENKSEREGAKKSLVNAGSAAETAVRKLLAAKSDSTLLAVCDVLAEIGTAETVPALRKLADTTPSKAVRTEAIDAADAIEKRLAEKK